MDWVGRRGRDVRIYRFAATINVTTWPAWGDSQASLPQDDHDFDASLALPVAWVLVSQSDL